MISSYIDTKILLNDHIKKHIKAFRNSPTTEKNVSKSCNKTLNCFEQPKR